MPPQVNPLTAPLSALKQIGEQTSAAIQQVGTGMASAASQTLDAFIAGAPPLPGLPGAPGVAARPNQLQPNLLPANLQQALSQVENILIPPGLPRPTQIMRGVVPTPPPAPAAPPAEAPPAPPAIAARRRVAERRGI